MAWFILCAAALALALTEKLRKDADKATEFIEPSARDIPHWMDEGKLELRRAAISMCHSQGE